MTGISALKLIASTPKKGSNLRELKRKKLCAKLDEQIQLAKAEQSGSTYAPTVIKHVKDPTTGQTSLVERAKNIKPWWWKDENGKTCIIIRYGARPLELAKGKNAIEAANISEVITTLQVVKSAVEAGKLDAQIDALGAIAQPVPKRETSTLRKAS